MACNRGSRAHGGSKWRRFQCQGRNISGYGDTMLKRLDGGDAPGRTGVMTTSIWNANTQDVNPVGNMKGKTVFIAGSSRGIGKAIALRMARDGANVVITGKTDAPHPTLPGTWWDSLASLLLG